MATDRKANNTESSSLRLKAPGRNLRRYVSVVKSVRYRRTLSINHVESGNVRASHCYPKFKVNKSGSKVLEENEELLRHKESESDVTLEWVKSLIEKGKTVLSEIQREDVNFSDSLVDATRQSKLEKQLIDGILNRSGSPQLLKSTDNSTNDDIKIPNPACVDMTVTVGKNFDEVDSEDNQSIEIIDNEESIATSVRDSFGSSRASNSDYEIDGTFESDYIGKDIEPEIDDLTENSSDEVANSNRHLEDGLDTVENEGAALDQYLLELSSLNGGNDTNEEYYSIQYSSRAPSNCDDPHEVLPDDDVTSERKLKNMSYGEEHENIHTNTLEDSSLDVNANIMAKSMLSNSESFSSNERGVKGEINLDYYSGIDTDRSLKALSETSSTSRNDKIFSQPRPYSENDLTAGNLSQNFYLDSNQLRLKHENPMTHEVAVAQNESDLTSDEYQSISSFNGLESDKSDTNHCTLISEISDKSNNDQLNRGTAQRINITDLPADLFSSQSLAAQALNQLQESEGVPGGCLQPIKEEEKEGNSWPKEPLGNVIVETSGDVDICVDLRDGNVEPVENEKSKSVDINEVYHEPTQIASLDDSQKSTSNTISNELSVICNIDNRFSDRPGYQEDRAKVIDESLYYSVDEHDDNRTLKTLTSSPRAEGKIENDDNGKFEIRMLESPYSTTSSDVSMVDAEVPYVSPFKGDPFEEKFEGDPGMLLDDDLGNKVSDKIRLNSSGIERLLPLHSEPKMELEKNVTSNSSDLTKESDKYGACDNTKEDSEKPHTELSAFQNVSHEVSGLIPHAGEKSLDENTMNYHSALTSPSQSYGDYSDEMKVKDVNDNLSVNTSEQVHQDNVSGDHELEIVDKTNYSSSTPLKLNRSEINTLLEDKQNFDNRDLTSIESSHEVHNTQPSLYKKPLDLNFVAHEGAEYQSPCDTHDDSQPGLDSQNTVDRDVNISCKKEHERQDLIQNERVGSDDDNNRETTTYKHAVEETSNHSKAIVSTDDSHNNHSYGNLCEVQHCDNITDVTLQDDYPNKSGPSQKFYSYDQFESSNVSKAHASKEILAEMPPINDDRSSLYAQSSTKANGQNDIPIDAVNEDSVSEKSSELRYKSITNTSDVPQSKTSSSLYGSPSSVHAIESNNQEQSQGDNLPIQVGNSASFENVGHFLDRIGPKSLLPKHTLSEDTNEVQEVSASKVNVDTITVSLSDIEELEISNENEDRPLSARSVISNPIAVFSSLAGSFRNIFEVACEFAESADPVDVSDDDGVLNYKSKDDDTPFDYTSKFTAPLDRKSSNLAYHDTKPSLGNSSLTDQEDDKSIEKNRYWENKSAIIEDLEQLQRLADDIATGDRMKSADRFLSLDSNKTTSHINLSCSDDSEGSDYHGISESNSSNFFISDSQNFHSGMRSQAGVYDTSRKDITEEIKLQSQPETLDKVKQDQSMVDNSVIKPESNANDLHHDNSDMQESGSDALNHRVSEFTRTTLVKAVPAEFEQRVAYEAQDHNTGGHVPAMLTAVESNKPNQSYESSSNPEFEKHVDMDLEKKCKKTVPSGSELSLSPQSSSLVKETEKAKITDEEDANKQIINSNTVRNVLSDERKNDTQELLDTLETEKTTKLLSSGTTATFDNGLKRDGDNEKEGDLAKMIYSNVDDMKKESKLGKQKQRPVKKKNAQKSNTTKDKKKLMNVKKRKKSGDDSVSSGVVKKHKTKPSNFKDFQKKTKNKKSRK